METRPVRADVLAVSTAASPRLPEPVRVLLAPVVLLASIFAPYLIAWLPGMREWIAGLSLSLAGEVAVGLVLLAGTTLVAVGLLAFLARYVDRVRLSDYGIRWDARSLPALLLGIGISVAVVVPACAALQALGLTRAVEARPDDISMWIIVTVALGQAFLLQGIPEELIFRGYLLTTLRNHGPVVAVWVSAIVFGLLHLVSKGDQQNLLEHFLYLLWPFGFGLAAGALRLTTASVWAAIGIHGGSHVGTLISELFGIGSGPAAWVTVGILYTVIGLVVLARFQRGGVEAVTD